MEGRLATGCAFWGFRARAALCSGWCGGEWAVVGSELRRGVNVRDVPAHCSVPSGFRLA